MNYLNGGYAMIKHNSTQEELQIAYRSKKPVLCYDENRRAHWAVIEETATESVDEETQEPITIYEYSYRLIDEASGGATLDDIVDSQGHKRFIEGEGTLDTIDKYTFTYNKWSLSGTHLMLVLAGTVSSGGLATIGTTFVSYELPEWILNKINPLAETGMISADNVTYYLISSGNYFVAKSILLKKETNKLSIVSNEGGNINNNVSFRIQFDLLIDADYSE